MTVAPSNKPRFRILLALGIVSVLLLSVLTWVGLDLLKATREGQELAGTVNELCDDGGSVARTLEREGGCTQAEQVPDPIDDPDPNDPENQEGENQDPENQDAEIQDTEQQDPENQDGELNDPDPVDDTDPNDPDPDDPETQDPEEQEGEIQEPEIQDPENPDYCPPGYTPLPFHYYGPDGVDNTEDEEDWLLCKKVE